MGSPGRRWEAMTKGISTVGLSKWWTSWKKSSGSPEKSLSTMTRARGAVSAASAQGAVPRRQVLGVPDIGPPLS